MAKITRKLAKIFGLSSGTDQVSQFGSLAENSPTYSLDPDVIQGLSNWDSGWYDAVVDINSPAIEDMNAFCYVMAYQIAYLLQQGVAEWNAQTTYYQGNLVNVFGVLYYSLVDNNLNHVITDPSYWSPMPLASGSITNSQISPTAGIVDTKLATIATAGKVSNSATTATNANTASTIVARDGSGNFSAGTITAALSGNATTATTSAAGNLTGTTLASNVVTSSLTSVGILTSLTTSGEFDLTGFTTLTTTGSSNNITTTGLSKIRYNGASAATYTGFANGSNGKILVIENSSASILTLTDNDSGSTSGNKIRTGSGGSALIQTNSGAILEYSSSDGVWRLIGISSLVGNQIFGVTDGSSALAGRIGESVIARVSTATNFTTSGQYNNITSISLTAGDWDVSGCSYIVRNGATYTDGVGLAISLFSGNTTTDHVSGDNEVSLSMPNNTGASSPTIPTYRMSLTSTSTVYLKVYGAYTGGPLQYYGRISARRMR